MRPYATNVCGLKLLVYGALSSRLLKELKELSNGLEGP
jgi:hypothetical protein